MSNNLQKARKACVIGAGPSGITAAKNLLQVGIDDFVVYEKSDKIGGNWAYSEDNNHSSVFETTHIISSKPMSQYADFPMPDHYADYPSHWELYEYFNNYAEEFGVTNRIQFNTAVVSATLGEDQVWTVTIEDGSSERFENLLVCNGHHWNPRMPEYPGRFDGVFVHSHAFKNNQGYEGKKVLVIGGGNSACDIAVETGRVSEQTFISMRRGYYFIPKFLMGKPVDQLNNGVRFLPAWLRKIVFKLLLKITVGDYRNYNMQKPDHEFLASHPVVNSELLYFIRHGRIKPKVGIEKLDGKTVHFKDGSSEEIDVILAATGYKITFPFFDKEMINFEDSVPELYKKIFHPDIANLYFIGLVQPMGCIWPLADTHAKLVANHIVGNYDLPDNKSQQIQRDIEKIKRDYIDTPRHYTEVRYDEHLTELMREMPKNAPEWN